MSQGELPSAASTGALVQVPGLENTISPTALEVEQSSGDFLLPNKILPERFKVEKG